MDQNESVEKNATLTCIYGSMYLQLDDYPPYSGKKSDIFETHINSNLRCIHVHTNYMRHDDLITLVSNYSWDMLLSKFIHAVKKFHVLGQQYAINVIRVIRVVTY